MQRLQKIIAQAGICSRRKAEELIAQGHVTVNGTRAQIGDKANLETDEIRVYGDLISHKQHHVYYALNKPIGIVCSASDEKGRKTVLDFVPHQPRVFSVGRLDIDTEGLLLLTNDGDWANSIAHPKNNIKKTYEVTVDRPFQDRDMEFLKSGIHLNKKITPDSVEKLQTNKIKLVIHEGQNRVVRRLMEKLGYEVIHLKRTQIGSLHLAKLKSGEYKNIKPQL